MFRRKSYCFKDVVLRTRVKFRLHLQAILKNWHELALSEFQLYPVVFML